MNKYNFWAVIAGVAIVVIIFGYWAKITHQPYADITLAIGKWTLAAVGAVLVYFLFTGLKKK